MKYPYSQIAVRLYTFRVLSFIICVSVFASLSLAQRTGTTPKLISSSALAAPVPVHFNVNGNVNCADLNDLHNPGDPPNVYTHIETDYELKYDSTPPSAATTHTFSSELPLWVLAGGATTDFNNTVTIRGYKSDPGSDRVDLLDWSSTRMITAVIVKSQTTNVYLYNPASDGGIPDGIGLTTPNGREISHVTFCFGIIGGTTAGDGSISGRVVNSYGVGISNARMSLVDATTGETVTALTNGFGHYTIDNIAVGEFYVLNIAHKRYRFAESTKAFSMSDNVANVDFIANP